MDKNSSFVFYRKKPGTSVAVSC